jgi:hypothetical protein
VSKKKRETLSSSSLQLEVLKNEVKAGIKVSRSKIILDPCKHLSVCLNFISRAISTRGDDYVGTKRTPEI